MFQIKGCNSEDTMTLRSDSNKKIKTPKIVVNVIRKYHNHKPQTTPWHREDEPLNNHETPGRQIKQSSQLPLPQQDDCNIQQNIIQLQTPS